MLGTGRLSIARAIGQIFFGGGGGGWTRFGKMNLENFQRKKKKKKLSGLEPMLVPLTVQCNYH